MQKRYKYRYVHVDEVLHDDIVADLHIVSLMHYAVILDVRGNSRGTAGPGRDSLHGRQHERRPALWPDSPCIPPSNGITRSRRDSPPACAETPAPAILPRARGRMSL